MKQHELWAFHSKFLTQMNEVYVKYEWRHDYYYDIEWLASWHWVSKDEEECRQNTQKDTNAFYYVFGYETNAKRWK